MGTQSTNFSADTFLLFLNPDILIMRDATCKILEMVDEGLLDPKMVAMACLGYMSEDDVKGMARANDINLEDEEDEDVEESIEGWDMLEFVCPETGDTTKAVVRDDGRGNATSEEYEEVYGR